MISRRNFVSGCSKAAAALAVAPVALSLSIDSRAALAGSLSYAAFAARVNTLFRVRLSSGDFVGLTLIKTRLAPRPPAAPGRRASADAANERFSLIFSGPLDAPLPAAIHTFEHDHLGRFEMYFGEIGARDGGFIRYEAVFNQAPPIAPGHRTLT